MASQMSALSISSSMAELLQEGKLMNDPIHGYIRMNKLCVRIMDTPEFQRLRDLKQLGSCYFVFPGASHCRFEHCVGVSHLASELVERVRHLQPELDVEMHELDMVRVAGLCHDLGHGPFSHVFDNEVIPRLRPGIKWKHEDASEMMLDYLVDQNGIDDLSTGDLRFIKDLIRGRPSGERKFLFDVVSNSRNGVDVDKFDYLARDCYNLGLKSSYDFHRLINFCKVIDDEICFHSKEAFTVYEMFHTRYALFKQVYSHKVGKAIEFMITDALVAADPVLKLGEAIEDPARYGELTDAVLRRLEFAKEPELQKSREIIRNIRKRNLYKCAEEVVMSERTDQPSLRSVMPEDVCRFAPEGVLHPEDVIIDDFRLNYSMKDRNPVDSIHFFDSWGADESFNIPKDKVSILTPGMFQERIVRIFVRNKAKAVHAREAFRAFLRHNRCVSPVVPMSQRALYDDHTQSEDEDLLAAAQESKRTKLTVFHS